MNYSLCIAISAFTSVVATGATVLFTYLKNANDSVVSRERNEKIINLQHQVARQQEQLLTRTEEISNEITGGDSICVLDVRILPSRINGGINTLTGWHEMISLVNTGKYELKNVNIRVEKPKLNLAFKRKANASNAQNRELEESFNVPSLMGKVNNQATAHVLIDRNMPQGHIINNSVTYAATIMTKKGVYSQIFKMVLNNDIWQSATIVTNRNGEVVYEVIDPRYPRKPDGSVDWTMID